jgi:hypothetical protein
VVDYESGQLQCNRFKDLIPCLSWKTTLESPSQLMFCSYYRLLVVSGFNIGRKNECHMLAFTCACDPCCILLISALFKEEEWPYALRSVMELMPNYRCKNPPTIEE